MAWAHRLSLVSLNTRISGDRVAGRLDLLQRHRILHGCSTVSNSSQIPTSLSSLYSSWFLVVYSCAVSAILLLPVNQCLNMSLRKQSSRLVLNIYNYGGKGAPTTTINDTRAGYLSELRFGSDSGSDHVGTLQRPSLEEGRIEAFTTEKATSVSNPCIDNSTAKLPKESDVYV